MKGIVLAVLIAFGLIASGVAAGKTGRVGGATPGDMSRSGVAMPVASATDLFGALVRTRTEPYQVLQAEFGLTPEGELGFSRLEILTSENEVVCSDSSDLFAVTFSDVSKLEGFWIPVGSGSNELRLWVDQFSFQVDEEGYFEIVYDHGTTESGQVYFLGGECDWATITICGKPLTCMSCGDPPFCLCNSGSPKCRAFFATGCAGSCEVGTCTDIVIIPPIGFPFIICGCI